MVIKLQDGNRYPDNIKEQFEKCEEKSFNANFKNVGEDFSSKNLFNNITKDSVYNIIVNLQLELDYPRKLRKNELIENLDKFINDNLSSICSKNLNMGEYNLIKKIIKNNGLIDYVHTKLNYELIIALRDLGLAFPIIKDGVKKICIPENYIKKLEGIYNDLTILSMVKEHDRLFKIAYAMVYYYGVVNYEVIQKKLALFINTDVDEFLLIRCIINHTKRYRQISFEFPNFIYHEVLIEDHIITEQNSRRDIDYAAFDQQGLLNVVESDFCVWNKYDRRMFEYLSGILDATPKEISQIVDRVIILIKNDIKMTSIVERICQEIVFDSKEQLEIIVSNISSMNNNCKMWVLKGHSPDELFSVERESLNPLPSKSIKIGRNAQCPCGSGKKYKNCCGIFSK